MAILRYGFIAIASAVLLYALMVLGSSLVFAAMELGESLDTGSTRTDMFFGVSGLTADVYDRTPLIRDQPQIILMGASNVQKFRADIVAAHLDGFAAHNMSIGGLPLHDWTRMADLTYEVVPRDAWSKLTFVVGVWYGTFSEGATSHSWQLDDEMARYGLYRRTAHGDYALRIPNSLVPAASIALRPVIVDARAWDTFRESNGKIVDALLLGRPVAQTIDVFEQDIAVLSDSKRRALLIQLRQKENGSISDRAFAELRALAQHVSRAGSRIVVVDLPIPQWHANAVPAFADYQRRKQPHFAALRKMKNVYYIDLQQGFSDSDFYDTVHARPKAAGMLSERLAAGLAPIVDSMPAGPGR